MDEDDFYAASNEPIDIQRDKFGRWVSREWENGFIERYNYKHSVKQLTKNKNKRKLRDAFKIEKVVKDKKDKTKKAKK